MSTNERKLKEAASIFSTTIEIDKHFVKLDKAFHDILASEYSKGNFNVQ